jgi:FMN phosphatase YigB (HAD superfamily)
VIAEAGGTAAIEALIASEHAQWFAMDTPDIATGRDNARASVFLDGVMARAGVALDVRARAMPVLDEVRGRGYLWDYVPAHVPVALTALRERGFRLGVVSNANGRMPEKLVRLGLAGQFDTIVDSGIEGVEKPDPRLFDIALARMGADRARTVFVGDLYHIDVVGAQRAELSPVLVDKAGLRTVDVPAIRRLTELLDLLTR